MSEFYHEQGMVNIYNIKKEQDSDDTEFEPTVSNTQTEVNYDRICRAGRQSEATSLNITNVVGNYQMDDSIDGHGYNHGMNSPVNVDADM